MKHGVIQATMLWHLMEEGTATCPRLSELSGVPDASLYIVLAKLTSRGLVQRGELQPRVGVRGPCARAYGLTTAGIEAALQVDQADVHFADDQVEQPEGATA